MGLGGIGFEKEGLGWFMRDWVVLRGIGWIKEGLGGARRDWVG